MHTTKQLLRRLAKTHGKTSDGQLAELLEISRSQMSNYRTGKRFPDDKVAVRLAARLGMSPGYVLACIQAERESDPALRQVWADVAQIMTKATKVAAAVTLWLVIPALAGVAAVRAALDCILS